MNYDDGFQQTLLTLIIEKASIVDFYTRLREKARNKNEKDLIFQILENEKRQLKQFTEMYISLTGRKPVYQINYINFNSYSEGLNIAFQEVLKNYDLYRNYYFSSSNPQIRDLFFLAFTDEIKNGSILNHLQTINEKQSPKSVDLKDYGPNPLVININDATLQNDNFRTALWTGKYLQLTLMSIDVGGEIGLEMHPDVDQFLRIEAGKGIVKMGDSKENLDFVKEVEDDFIILVPAGKWHNVINTGDEPLKVYSLYGPPNHPHGTIHRTMEEAEEDHH